MQRDHIFHAAFYFVNKRHISCRVHWTSPIQLPVTCNTSCISTFQKFEEQPKGSANMTLRVLWGSDPAVTLPSHKTHTRQVALGFVVQNSYWSYDLLENFQLHSTNAALYLGTQRLMTGNSNQRQLFLFFMRNMFFWSSNYH